MNAIKLRSGLVLFFAMVINLSFSQQAGVNTAAQIEKAIAEQDGIRADAILQAQLNTFIASGAMDSLSEYVQYLGRIAEMNANPETAVKKVNLFIEKVKGYSPNALLLTRIYSEAGKYFGSIGMNKLAYTTNQQAYKYANQWPGIKAETLASINSDLGTFAVRMGDISLGSYHHRKAISFFLTAQHPDYERLYTAANNMGSAMWYASKLDSSIYYFDIALRALAKTDHTPINQYYRPAVLQNNMTGIYNMQGETTRAIAAMKACIDNLKKYLSIPESVPKIPNTVSFQFEATDNLGAIYKDLGDYSMALQLLDYSYRQKQKDSSDQTGVFKSQILLGQLYLAMKDHVKAHDLLKEGLANISKADGDFLVWQADACSSLALLYKEQDNKEQAAYYFAKADSLYEVTLQGEYDEIYLDFLRNAALFYSENGQLPIALQKAGKGLAYVKKSQGATTLMTFYQLLTLSEVYFNAGNYKQALDYSKKGITVVDGLLRNSTNGMDSIKTELQKPKAILLREKSTYYLMADKNVNNLSALLKELDLALAILEKRKTLINDSKDIGLLLADHMDLLNFNKKIILDLYNLTHDAGYIDRLINLHESALYNRLRARLDKTDSIRFVRVPADIQLKERQLKTAIRAALEKNESHGKNMAAYFATVADWNAFQQDLKKQYPEYYKMRYESIFKSLDDIQQTIPASITVVRYLFIEKQLLVVVMDQQQKQLLLLDATGIDNNIKSLASYSTGLAAASSMLFDLYNQLWKPIEQFAHTRRIIIVPDGILYNLNFEMLTPRRIQGYEQLATHSLLAKHAISYQYSLALGTRQKNSLATVKDNFVAFAPGFSDQDKQRYRSAIKDDAQVDEAYVSLLPQPFTLNFVDKAKSLLGGKAYTSSESTVTSFKNNAGAHRIIHIGTHAESNNLSPEFSRLIFSKDGEEPNSIFLFDIYNCDLSAELAVLTACESGKPGYQDGEGMISMAHAFNYAGSESIITGLWKIDEEASSMLMDVFYKNLLAGMEKDEALRQAKLQYLRVAKGRMLSPQYWAGLVLVGDSDAIQLEKNKSYTNWWFIAAILLVIGGVIAFVYKKRTKHAAA